MYCAYVHGCGQRSAVQHHQAEYQQTDYYRTGQKALGACRSRLNTSGGRPPCRDH